MLLSNLQEGLIKIEEWKINNYFKNVFDIPPLILKLLCQLKGVFYRTVKPLRNKATFVCCFTKDALIPFLACVI